MGSGAEGPVLIFSARMAGVDRRELRRFAARLSGEVAGGARFTCLFTGDSRLRQLNRRFLGKDYATDVLSFPSASPDGGLGEMAVSVARAREQAAARGHALEEELRILMLHGVLHLAGHDHETDRGAMRRLETRWRKRLGLRHGLIEREAG
jgi:probable rRNA maturation factor